MRPVNSEEKRLLILQQAISAFAEHGFERTSISEIASRTGIATGGVYNYFPNKQALFQACSHRIYEEFSAGISAGMDLEAAIRYTLGFFSANIDYSRIALLETKNFAIRFPDSGLLPLWFEKTGDLLRSCLRREALPGQDGFYVPLVLGAIESLLVVRIFRPALLGIGDAEIATRLARMIRRELAELDQA